MHKKRPDPGLHQSCTTPPPKHQKLAKRFKPARGLATYIHIKPLYASSLTPHCWLHTCRPHWSWSPTLVGNGIFGCAWVHPTLVNTVNMVNMDATPHGFSQLLVGFEWFLYTNIQSFPYKPQRSLINKKIDKRTCPQNHALTCCNFWWVQVWICLQQIWQALPWRSVENAGAHVGPHDVVLHWRLGAVAPCEICAFHHNLIRDVVSGLGQFSVRSHQRNERKENNTR